MIHVQRWEHTHLGGHIPHEHDGKDELSDYGTENHAHIYTTDYNNEGDFVVIDANDHSASNGYAY